MSVEKKMIARTALRKLLGKKEKYVATFLKFSYDKKSVLFIDVKHKGKIVAEHIWIKFDVSLAKTKKGDTVNFDGTANSYKDSKGDRKYGITDCHNFFTNLDDSYVEMKNQSMQDFKYKKNRKRRKK